MKIRKWSGCTIVIVLFGMLGMLQGCASVPESDGLLFLVEQEPLSGTEKEDVFSQSTESESAENNPSDNAQKIAVVHICGEVLLPGVYEVPADARIIDVVQIAGGFTSEASEEYMNLALPVSDGMQIVILSEEEAQEAMQRKETSTLININTATADELCELPGIGKSRAADIIAYRNQNGGFVTTQDIMKVSGIKTAMYEKLKDKICVE